MTDIINPIKKFEIVLESETYQYEPGEILQGDVVLVIEESMSLSADSICVELRGEAQVCWQSEQLNVTDDSDNDRLRNGDVINTDLPARRRGNQSARYRRRHRDDVIERNGANNSSRSQLHRAVETYVNEKLTTLTSTDGAGRMTTSNDDDKGDIKQIISAGEHRYPFHFRLPKNLPSSFRGQYGSVGYALRASIVSTSTATAQHLSFGGKTAVVKQPFFVKRCHHVSSDNSVSPVSQNIETISWSNDSRQSAANVLIEVSRRSSMLNCLRFVGRRARRVEFAVRNGTQCRLGDCFRIDVSVTQNSRQSGLFVEISLVQLSTFTAGSVHRRTVALVSRCDSDNSVANADDNNKRSWRGMRLTVPTNLPESGLLGCNIINIQYELRFNVQISYQQKMKARLPVTVISAMSSDVTAVKSMTSSDDMVVNSNITDDVIMQFRRPIVPGETRHNLLFNQNSME